MLKFNLNGLNNMFRNTEDKNTEKDSASSLNTIVTQAPTEVPKEKRRFSAYRTVVARHEELAAKIGRGEEDQDD